MTSAILSQDLRKRVVTAAGLVAALVVSGAIAAFHESGWLIFLLLGFLLVGLAAYEFAALSKERRRLATLVYFGLSVWPPLAVLYLLTGKISGAGVLSASPLELGVITAAAGLFLSYLLALLYLVSAGMRSLEKAAQAAQDLFIGIFLIGFCGALLLALTSVPDSYSVLAWLVLVVSLNDTAAYFVGRRIGGPRLAPVISPGKTVSGSIGGLAVGSLAGTLSISLLPGTWDYIDAVLFSALLSVSAQVGDLAKSYLKRLHGAKDSGTILPGHGGVFDRIDGILMAAPIVCFFLTMKAW